MAKNQETLDIISALLLSIGIACCCFTMLLILINYRQMVSNIYARLVFMIQLMVLATFIAGYHTFVDFSDLTLCRVAGAFQYFFLLVSHLSI